MLALIGVLAPAAPAQEALPYQVQIQGVEDPILLEDLRSLSDSIRLREEKPVASLDHLERRAARDREAFTNLLHARGRYDADVAVDIDPDIEPVALAFTIEPGPQYTLKEVDIRDVDAGTPAVGDLPEPEALGLEPGTPFRAQAVLDAENELIRLLQRQGHAFAEVPDRDVVVDHADQTVSVTYKVDAGAKAVFGPLEVKGLDTVREAVVQKYVEWDEGAIYDERLVTKTQNVLYRTGLFSTVRVAPAAEAGADTEAVPMVVEVTERKHRTIAAGLEYHSDRGAGLRVYWEHRNIRGLGRTLSIESNIGQIQTSIESKYTFRRWRRDGQTLELGAHAGQWDPEAYTSRRVGATAWVERKLRGPWSVGTGLSARWDEIEQDDETQQYHLLSNPWRLTFDNRDDPLNPTLGRRITLRGEPFVGLGGGALTFVKGEVNYSEYFGLNEERSWLLAVRGRLGISGGVSRDGMPPDERFYAGGAGSIRGYAYQTVGPVDEDDDPLGGRSVADMSLELRYRFTESIGAVAFVDGGSAFDAAYPEFNDFRLGAGVGMRYYTPIGPIGVDLAVPLNKRDFDSSFQVYITLGQAF